MNSLDAFDDLTGVANRSGWIEAASLALQKGSAPKVILYIDLDRFKFVNDSLGHHAGDHLLQNAADILKQSIHSGVDIPGRMGGDEFVVLLQSPDSVNRAEQIANDIISRLRRPLLIDDTEVEIGASIGTACFPRDADDLEQLLKYADLAMYRAKNSGRNQVVQFHQQMVKKIEFRRDIQTRLRKALKQEQLEPRYVPIYDVLCQRAVAVELNVDCSNVERLQNLDQYELFSIADESQVAIQLSEWMFEQGLSFIHKMNENGIDVDVVIPVRPSHFHQKGFVDWLADLLDEYQQSPESVIIQLNDACLNVQRFPVEQQLQSLNRLGIEVAVHNFGTGHISPMKLHDWPISQLDLSASFVIEMTSKRSIESMTEALIKMGQMLNKRVVAYGVSSLEQQEFLSSHQCFLMQGPLLAGPMTAADFEFSQLDQHRQSEEPIFSEFEDIDGF